MAGKVLDGGQHAGGPVRADELLRIGHHPRRIAVVAPRLQADGGVPRIDVEIDHRAEIDVDMRRRKLLRGAEVERIGLAERLLPHAPRRGQRLEALAAGQALDAAALLVDGDERRRSAARADERRGERAELRRAPDVVGEEDHAADPPLADHAGDTGRPGLVRAGAGEADHQHLADLPRHHLDLPVGMRSGGQHRADAVADARPRRRRRPGRRRGDGEQQRRRRQQDGWEPQGHRASGQNGGHNDRETPRRRFRSARCPPAGGGGATPASASRASR